MSIAKVILGLWISAFSLHASATDYSWGGRSPEGQEFPRLSVRVEGTIVKVRLKTFRRDVSCSQWRPDFCGIEDQVDMVEFESDRNAFCEIKNEKLLACSNVLSMRSGHAFLKNGQVKELIEIAGRVTVGELTSLEFDGTGQHQEQKSLFATFDLWGHRADGLDPLATYITSNGMFVVENLQVIQKSLFNP